MAKMEGTRDIVAEHNQNAFNGEQGVQFDGRGCNIHKGEWRAQAWLSLSTVSSGLSTLFPRKAAVVRPSGTDSPFS